MTLMKDAPPVKNDENHPWTDVAEIAPNYTVYKDKFPVTRGHMLFVPMQNDTRFLEECLIGALHKGRELKNMGICDGFNVGLNWGKAAGQTKDWPHVHLILRYEGDCKDPTGGVRNVIPGKGKYE